MSETPDIAKIRSEYTGATLDEANLPDDPFALFSQWFDAAHSAGMREPNAATLATADPDGRPSARIVLLKGFGPAGFEFYTNYESRKAVELDGNPSCAMVFWWPPLERQVRIEGPAERVTEKESDEYFSSRPRGSQIGAWVSPQSRAIENRSALEKSLQEAEEIFEGRDVPRPSNWGGFRLKPETIEFWQGRALRLHDRIVYRLERGGWHRERLAP